MQSHIQPRIYSLDKILETMQSIALNPELGFEKVFDLLIDDLGRVGKNAWEPKLKPSELYRNTDGQSSPRSETRNSMAARRLVAESKHVPDAEDKEGQLPHQPIDRLFTCLQHETVISLIDEQNEVAILLANFFSRHLPTKVIELPDKLLKKLYPAPAASDARSHVSDEKELKSLQQEVSTEQCFKFFLSDLEQVTKKRFVLSCSFMRDMLTANWLFKKLDNKCDEDGLIASLHCETIISRIDRDGEVATLLRNLFRYLPDRLIDIPAELFVTLYAPKPQLEEVKAEKDSKEESKSEVRNVKVIKRPDLIKEMEAFVEAKISAEEKESKENNAQFEKLLEELRSDDDQTNDILGILEKSSPKQLDERLGRLFEFYSSFIPQLKTEYPKYQHHITFLNAVVNKVFDAPKVQLFTPSTFALMMNFFSELIYIPATFNLGSLALECLRANMSFHKKLDKVIEPFLNSDLVSTKKADGDQVISINRIILTLFIYICYLKPSAEKIVKKLFELMDDSLNKIDECNKVGLMGVPDSKQKTHYLNNLSQIASTLACMISHLSFNKSEEAEEIRAETVRRIKEIRAEVVRRIFDLIANYDFPLMSSAVAALVCRSAISISEAAKLASILRGKNTNNSYLKANLFNLAALIRNELLSQYANPKCNLLEWSKESFPANKSPNVAEIIWSYVTTEPAPSALRR